MWKIEKLSRTQALSKTYRIFRQLLSTYYSCPSALKAACEQHRGKMIVVGTDSKFEIWLVIKKELIKILTYENASN